MKTRLKNMGLFLAAPFIALAYIVALPIVGFYAVFTEGRKALKNKKAPEAQPDEQAASTR